MDTTTTPAATDITVEEMLNSLTGFDEIAVSKAFGLDVFTLLDTTTITGGRALVFVHKRRQGMSDTEAKAAALSMTVRETDAYFAAEPTEIDAEAPETDAGKDS